jgi:GT2 family glycosyltransferase
MFAKPKVSVIIATYGREQVLCDTLSQVLSEPYENKEVVVIDQTPEHTPGTRNYLESVRASIRYIRMDHPSVTEAENLGIREATGDLLLFVDDDVKFEPGLIEAHVRNYADPHVSGVAGQVLEVGCSGTHVLSGGTDSPRFGYFFFRHDYAGRARVANVAEGNMSFRRQALLDAGLIDERFRENAYLWGMDLALRVVKSGGRIVHDPSATLVHLRYRSGGVRMKAVRPLSYFRNLFYFLGKHHARHERFAIAVRVFFYRVLVEGRRRPWVIPANASTFLKAWRLERKGPS